MESTTSSLRSRISRIALSFRRKPSTLKKLIARFTKLKGPMSSSDRFITLDEEYLNKFDEIVVVGDIHGCSSEFKELLGRVHIESTSRNSSKCLKILVGDLVNKGPNSEKVLALCRDQYPDSILAVRGNHDEIVLDNYDAFKSGTRLAKHNKWIESLPTRYIEYLRSLPYTISIPSLNCIIVHAGLQPSVSKPAKETPTRLMTTMRNIVVETRQEGGDSFYEYKCTKSGKEGAPWATFWSGPEHVYFGHDARRRLQDNHEFATGLDTGCVYGDRLSYIYIKGRRKGEILSVKAREVYEPTSDTELPHDSTKIKKYQ